METMTLQRPVIRPLDALWALFESQPKNVRKAFVKRLLQEDVEAETTRQQLVVKQSLTQAFKELADAEKNGMELPDARNLFKQGLTMNVDFKYLPEFEKRAKALAKKYKSFVKDYDDFLDSLAKDPYQGTSLGMGVYKTRMAIVAKGKGKSGGVRVLTYNVKKTAPNVIIVTLLSIFDKGEMENVSDAYIKSLVKEVKKNPNL